MSVRVKRLKIFHLFFLGGGGDLTEKKRQKAQFVAHVRHAQASEAGIEILELSTQLSQCVLQGLSECFGKRRSMELSKVTHLKHAGASHLQPASAAAEELRSLLVEAQIQQPPAAWLEL